MVRHGAVQRERKRDTMRHAILQAAEALLPGRGSIADRIRQMKDDHREAIARALDAIAANRVEQERQREILVKDNEMLARALEQERAALAEASRTIDQLKAVPVFEVKMLDVADPDV